jgi:hypothetical protein
MPSFPTFVGDIQERDSSPANPPVAPSLKPNVNGFPAHKKRVPRMSAFKQQRAAKDQQAAAAPKAPAKMQDAPKPRSAFGLDRDEERRAIDEENRQTLAGMSDAEIEQERQELMSSLNPASAPDPKYEEGLLRCPRANKGSNVTTSTESDTRHTIFARRRHRIGSCSGCRRLNTLPTTSTTARPRPKRSLIPEKPT